MRTLIITLLTAAYFGLAFTSYSQVAANDAEIAIAGPVGTVAAAD